ncbi:SHOCT domain-containing protein [Paenibacillus hamazuiensis]|uniref:SHOCT domain-containing protein n=1 Tax=Paenibacillus hamazuiensis TaxID=2936508 RepID=UPI002010A0E6|nr:SHOCT domain-containing protein [Paenibacillus hamazuiensis]
MKLEGALNLSNFNVETKVTDGGVWWDNVREKKGWKLQKHKITGHYRIISPSKYRKAWGSDREEMLGLFDEFTYEEPKVSTPIKSQKESTPTKPSKQEILAQLKDLGELYENGVLTKDEFEGAKKKLLNEL